MEVWGLCPQRDSGAEPLVRGSGGKPLPLKLNATEANFRRILILFIANCRKFTCYEDADYAKTKHYKNVKLA